MKNLLKDKTIITFTEILMSGALFLSGCSNTSEQKESVETSSVKSTVTENSNSQTYSALATELAGSYSNVNSIANVFNKNTGEIDCTKLSEDYSDATATEFTFDEDGSITGNGPIQSSTGADAVSFSVKSNDVLVFEMEWDGEKEFNKSNNIIDVLSNYARDYYYLDSNILIIDGGIFRKIDSSVTLNLENLGITSACIEETQKEDTFQDSQEDKSESQNLSASTDSQFTAYLVSLPEGIADDHVATGLSKYTISAYILGKIDADVPISTDSSESHTWTVDTTTKAQGMGILTKKGETLISMNDDAYILYIQGDCISTSPTTGADDVKNYYYALYDQYKDSPVISYEEFVQIAN